MQNIFTNRIKYHDWDDKPIVIHELSISVYTVHG